MGWRNRHDFCIAHLTHTLSLCRLAEIWNPRAMALQRHFRPCCSLVFVAGAKGSKQGKLSRWTWNLKYICYGLESRLLHDLEFSVLIIKKIFAHQSAWHICSQWLLWLPGFRLAGSWEQCSSHLLCSADLQRLLESAGFFTTNSLLCYLDALGTLSLLILFDRRKFRSLTSDNMDSCMDSWKAD